MEKESFVFGGCVEEGESFEEAKVEREKLDVEGVVSMLKRMDDEFRVSVEVGIKFKVRVNC